MNKNLSEELQELQQEIKEKTSSLYNSYIEKIEEYKNNETFFDIASDEGKGLMNDINSDDFLNTIQKIILNSLLYFTTSDTDHYSMSYVLKSFLDRFKELIDSDLDAVCSIRNIFSDVYSDLNNRISVYPLKDEYIKNKLFSYTDGVSMDLFRVIADKLAVYERDCMGITPSVLSVIHFKNGVGYLSPLSISGSSLFWYIHKLFKNHEDDKLTLQIYNSKDTIEFERGSFDIAYNHMVDGKYDSIKHEFDLSYIRDVKFSNAMEAYKKLEIMKELLDIGYASETSKIPPQVMYAISDFVRRAYHEANGTSDNLTKEKDVIKSLINVVSIEPT